MRPFARTFFAGVLIAVVASVIFFYLQPYLPRKSDEDNGFQAHVPAGPGVVRHVPLIQTVSYGSDGSTTWRANEDGIAIEWARNGTIQRIFSRYSVPVSGASNVAIANAQTVAEEKAKAAIVRFMGETVSTTRIVTQIEYDLARATMLRQAGHDLSAARADQHVLVQALTDVTRSYATGELEGVVVLDRGYDPQSQMAWTTVGIDTSTIRGAQGVRAVTSDGDGREATEPEGERR